MNIIKITAYSIINTGEGKRITCVYSVVEVETGKIISENNRVDYVVLDSETQGVITSLEKLIESKLKVIPLVK